MVLQIVFEATRGQSVTGDIAIDDIRVTIGRCGGKREGQWRRREREV